MGIFRTQKPHWGYKERRGLTEAQDSWGAGGGVKGHREEEGWSFQVEGNVKDLT